jgi:integrase
VLLGWPPNPVPRGEKELELPGKEIENLQPNELSRAAFTTHETARLFEEGSPLLRGNPYALSGPPNTVRAHRSDWKVFVAFCEVRHFLALPAQPWVVAVFIESMSAGHEGEKRSAATIQRYMSTIAQAHALSDLPDPTRTAYVRGAVKANLRGRPASQPRQALRWESISKALEALDTGSKTWDLRAKALLATAYSTMARRSELVALTVEDLKIDASGEGTALIYVSKVDREEARYLSTEAVLHLKNWLEHAQIREGAVFRRLERTGRVGDRSLHPQEVGRIFERVGEVITALGIDWPTLKLGAHSTRIGAAHDMVAAGIDLTSIMHSGGWRDPKMPRYYTRELAARDSGMARMVRARTAADKKG